MEDGQVHPLHETDKKIIDSLITKQKPDDFDLISLARLINRYDNFPGEYVIQADIEKIMKFWNLSKENLFSKTRNLWEDNFRPPDTSKDLIGSGFDTSE